MFEEHGEVLASWLERRYWCETVVCLDQHLDLKVLSRSQLSLLQAAGRDPQRIVALNRDIPFRDDDSFAYGLDSFLFAAVMLGLVRRIIWVIPEPWPISAAQLAAVLWDNLSLLPGEGGEVRAWFEVGEYGATSRVRGVRIDITTLRRLPALVYNCNARVDIDLDYFAYPPGRRSHSPMEVATSLRGAGLGDRVESITFSVSSGFLPASERSVGEELAKALGAATEPVTPGPKGPSAALDALVGGPVDATRLGELWHSELSALGGAGWAMRSILTLRGGDLNGAMACYANARAAGDRASWVAYALGLHYLGCRNYPAAASWLGSAEGEVIDTMQARSTVLRSLATLKSGRVEEAYELAMRAVDLLPMRWDAYQVAATAATLLGHKAKAAELRASASSLAYGRRRMQ